LVLASGLQSPPVVREANLSAYFSDRPELAETLRHDEPREVEWLGARSGAPTVRLRGQYLSSSVDPEAEARALCAEAAVQEADLVVLFGLGAGHALRTLRATSRARVVVFEPSRDVLAMALERLDLVGDPLLHPDALVHDLATLRLCLSALYGVGDRIALAVLPAYRRHFPIEAAQLAAEVGFFAEQARLAENTYDLRLPIWIENLIANLPARARFASAVSLEGRFRGVPAVIVSAGPSLSGNVATLAAFRDRALVLSTNTAYRALAAAGIAADFVIALEALDIRAQLEGLPGLGETYGLVDGVAHPGLFDLPFLGGFVFDDGIPFYQRWLEKHFSPVAAWSSGMCVAHAAFSAALALGCDPIVLVGQDLAHREGQVYATGTLFEEMRARPLGDRVRYEGVEGKLEIERRTAERTPELWTFRPEETRVRLPGYSGGEVESTLTLAAFRRWFENAAAQYGKERTLLNCTEGGARIEGFAQCPLAEVASSLGEAASVRGRLAELAARPALGRQELRQRSLRAAAELEAIAHWASRAPRSEAARERVRALCRDHTLLNGYLRKEMRLIRAQAREAGAHSKGAHERGAELEERLYRTIREGAQRLARALRRVASGRLCEGKR
jgi:hypothetical protein